MSYTSSHAHLYEYGPTHQQSYQAAHQHQQQHLHPVDKTFLGDTSLGGLDMDSSMSSSSPDSIKSTMTTPYERSFFQTGGKSGKTGYTNKLSPHTPVSPSRQGPHRQAPPSSSPTTGGRNFLAGLTGNHTPLSRPSSSPNHGALPTPASTTRMAPSSPVMMGAGSGNTSLSPNQLGHATLYDISSSPSPASSPSASVANKKNGLVGLGLSNVATSRYYNNQPSPSSSYAKARTQQQQVSSPAVSISSSTTSQKQALPRVPSRTLLKDSKLKLPASLQQQRHQQHQPQQQSPIPSVKSTSPDGEATSNRVPGQRTALAERSNIPLPTPTSSTPSEKGTSGSGISKVSVASMAKQLPSMMMKKNPPKKLNISVPNTNAGNNTLPSPTPSNASTVSSSSTNNNNNNNNNNKPEPSPKPKEKEPLSAARLIGYPLHPLFASQYTIHEELGAGGFGFVVRGSRNVDGLPVAIKFVLRKKIPAHGWVRSRSWGDPPGLKPSVNGERLVPLEAYVLRHINHPNIVRFIDMFEDDTYMYLVMEHHGSPWQGRDKSGGNNEKLNKPSVASKPITPPLSPLIPSTPLAAEFANGDISGTSSSANDSGFLSVNTSSSSSKMLSPNMTSTPSLSPNSVKSPALSVSSTPGTPNSLEKRSYDLFECIEQMGHLPESKARYVFSQVVEAVYALDRRGICHRDIKDENIVIDSEFRVKLIDFGSAVIFDPANPPYYTSFFGTTSFASAEILRGESYKAPSSEVWSLGVLLTVLVSGGCPFSDPEAASQGRRARLRVPLSKSVQDLINRCLELDVNRRITISDIRRHPWLHGAH